MWIYWSTVRKISWSIEENCSPLTKNVLAPLASMASASAIDGPIQRKIRWRGMIATNRAGVARAKEGITFLIMNEDMDDIIRIIKSLKKLGALNFGNSETVQNDIKNK